MPSLSASNRPVEKLVATLDDALGLLEAFSPPGVSVPVAGVSPASLLEHCLELCEQRGAVEPEPVRLVHHFACTGGSLICKCLAAMPSAQVLSEVDPLSPLGHDPEKLRFAPTDMVTLMRQSTRGTSAELSVAMFLRGLAAIHAEATLMGQRLVLRDHAHSHFCVGTAIPDRPSLREIVASALPVLSVVTVRHPVDSFLSLTANRWLHFQPATFDEYCGRYLAFLRAYEGVPRVRYEDFVAQPRETMRALCALLRLPYLDQFVELFTAFRMTGDSGRGGNVIESKPRRALEESQAREWRASSRFRELAAELRYDALEGGGAE
jgi:hypothetical protein